MNVEGKWEPQKAGILLIAQEGKCRSVKFYVVYKLDSSGLSKHF